MKDINISKRHCIVANTILLAWFFLDMVGVYFKESYLVTRSWKEDGIFFLIFLLALLVFVYKERIGKYILSAWLSIWLITQFFSHEWFTIIGGGEGKIRYFKDSIKLIDYKSRYIPDVYHIILHILILISLVMTISYCTKSIDRKANSDYI